MQCSGCLLAGLVRYFVFMVCSAHLFTGFFQGFSTVRLPNFNCLLLGVMAYR
ncbi:hypothetical protein M433DRAFT_158689, partial [Acidomyces richmondensis BFW]